MPDATTTTSKSDQRLITARSDARTALRDINRAIDGDGSDREFHLGQAVARLEFALTALRTLAKAG